MNQVNGFVHVINYYAVQCMHISSILCLFILTFQYTENNGVLDRSVKIYDDRGYEICRVN